MNQTNMTLHFAMEFMTDEHAEAKAHALMMLESCGITAENIERAMLHRDELLARFGIDVEKLMIAHSFLDIGCDSREVGLICEAAESGYLDLGSSAQPN